MSQQYLLPCSCGQTTPITSAQAGEQLSCICGQRLSVPTLRGIRELEEAPLEANGAAAGNWSPVHGVAFSAGLLISLAGAALIAFFFLRYAQIRFYPGGDLTKDWSADVVKAAGQNVDQLTPTQLLDTWKTEILTEGLGERQMPIWIAAKAKLAQYTRRMILGAALLAMGILLSAGTLLISRPRAV